MTLSILTFALSGTRREEETDKEIFETHRVDGRAAFQDYVVEEKFKYPSCTDNSYNYYKQKEYAKTLCILFHTMYSSYITNQNEVRRL